MTRPVLVALMLSGLLLSCAEDPSLNRHPGVDAATQIFAAYLGGSAHDSIRDVAADSHGNLYVTGGTTSRDFPVTSGAYQRSQSKARAESRQVEPFDVFVSKLGTDGRMIWSTLVGGPNYDRAYAIEVDEAGFVYVAGRAGAGFPVTAGAAQTRFMGGMEAAFYGHQDGFVLKLSPDGSRLEWATYFGTADPEIVRDIAVDRDDNVYLASGLRGGSYPPGISEAFLNSPRGGHDAIIAKLAPDGTKVLWARYVGGSATEHGNGSVRINADGVPHLLFTSQSGGIATPGAADTSYAGDEDMCVTRFDSVTGAEGWTTYIGGSANESTETHEFAGFDAAGNAYVSGPTKSRDFPTTPEVFSRIFTEGDADSNDIFVAKISADGRQLLAGTYVGGRGFDRTEGAAVDAAGNVYLTGVTSSRDFPLTPEAMQTSRGGDRDMFVVKLSSDLKLRYASYAGGRGVDSGRAAALDPHGDFYIAGETTSNDWPGAVGDARARRGGSALVARYHFARAGARVAAGR